MKLIIEVLIISILAVVCSQQADGSINYKGNFDSMNQNTQQQQIQSQQEDSVYEQQQEDMLQFSEHMADFFPDQTFTFKLRASEQQNFMLWPGSDVENIRGMFHSQVTNNEDQDSYVNLALFDNDQLVRDYKQQRLGIFNIPHAKKDHRYTFKFQNGQSSTQVYFSYEFVTRQKKESKVQKNETQIEVVTKKFQKVNKLIVQQQSQMRRLMGISERHQQKVDHYLSSVQWTLLLQTLLISIGNSLSLWLLKKQIYAGYQLLV